MSYYMDIFRSLQKHGVRYLVVGGLAVNLHGVERATADVDLVISLDRGNVEKITEALSELGFKPRLPVDPVKLSDPSTLEEWVNEKHMKAFAFIHPSFHYMHVDLVIVHPLNFDEMYEHRKIESLYGVEISVVSIDDLIRLKRHAGRDIDIHDAMMLSRRTDGDADGA